MKPPIRLDFRYPTVMADLEKVILERDIVRRPSVSPMCRVGISS